MAADTAPSEIIERQRTALLKILQQDPDCVIDSLTSRRLISDEESETLENVPDSLKKCRKLLILVQKKGEVTCQCFLKCLFNIFPESASIELLQHENTPRQSTKLSTNSEDAFPPETQEITMFSEKKEHLDLETTEFCRDKESSCRETAPTSRENEKECDTPLVPYSFERAGYEVPATVTYLKAGQRYDEPDDSLYLGEPYPASAGCSEDEACIVEEGDCDDLEHLVNDSEEEDDLENMRYASEESSYEDSETDISLEEEEKRMEERKEAFKHILSCLNMDRSRKLLPGDVKQFSLGRGYQWTPETPGDLAWNFLMKVQALDVEARDAILRHRVVVEDSPEDLLTGMENLEIRDTPTINPLDVLCACMLCSDSSLRREVMSNMYECHFALPLLLPDAENNRSLLMLGAMSGVLKRLSTQPAGESTEDTEKSLSLLKMPVISFVRLGHCSFSKSRILNALLSPAQKKSNKVFLHQDVSLPVLPRQISDGLVEISWYFPDSHELKESSHFFQKPVAVANLRGDLESFWTQFGFLVEVSSAVFFFTDHLGEREWDLLMFLGEAALERCYFVLSPQAKESEEAQIFQRILKLKPSQLLSWEGEEAGDRRKSMEALQAALREVMSSSLRCVSVEDMASLARELGIQVDQDFELAQGIPVSPNRTAASEKQQRHSQTESSPEKQGTLSVRENGAEGEVSQNAQSSHQSPPVQRPLPLPTKVGVNFNNVPLNAPWVMGTHFESGPRAKWFNPLPFQNTRAYVRGKHFGIHYFKPQRSYSGERFMKFSGASWAHPLSGTFWRAPRPVPQHVWTRSERLQTTRALQRSRAGVSHVGCLHSVGSQLTRAVRKPPPGKAHAQGAQLTETTGNVMRTSHIKYPHPQCFQQPAGAVQKLVRPASHQGTRGMIHGGPSSSVSQTKSHSMSGSKLSLTPQPNSHQPKPQAKHFQPKPSQPVLAQPKPSQPKSPQPQPSQTKPSLTKPAYSQSYATKTSSSKPAHSQSSHATPSQPKRRQSQSKPSQPRPIQPKSSQAKPSQAKAYQPRAGPGRAGKR
uniref:Caspase recruitment domain family, member 6 n=1 Tax=Jaculus jaculus TaxID=51337 RepID=A0A8C5LCN9_JACJA